MAEPTDDPSYVGRLRLPREPFNNITIPRAHLDSGIVTTESHPQLEGFRELGGGSCASDVGTLGAVGQRPTVSESGPDTVALASANKKIVLLGLWQPFFP